MFGPQDVPSPSVSLVPEESPGGGAGLSAALRGEPRRTLSPFPGEYNVPESVRNAQNLQQGIANRAAMAQAGDPTVSAAPPVQGPLAVDDMTHFESWRAKTRESGAAANAENQARRERNSVLDKFASEIGRVTSPLGFFRYTEAEREAGQIFRDKFNELLPQLRNDPALFGRFQQDPRGFINAALDEGKSATPQPLAQPTQTPPPVSTDGMSTVGGESAQEKTDINLYPETFTPTTPVDESAGKNIAALQGKLSLLEAQEVPDVTGQADEFFKTLTDANKKIYSDLEAGLKVFEKADAKDFEKLESRFKALDDFYETGKLPERMRQDRITNLMLEMSKGLLGSQDLYSGFKAGLEGFQTVDKASRDEYAKGLAARLTASKGIIDSRVAMRNARRQESIAMTKFAAAENRGNAALAMEQLKIAQQAKQNARTHQINLIRGKASILSADAALRNSMKGTDIERLLRDLPGQMYAGALAKAKDGDRTELDRLYYRDSEGKVHPNIPAFISEVNRLKSSGYGSAQQASLFDRAKISFQKDVATSVNNLIKAGWTKQTAPQWRAIAKSIGMKLPTGAIEFDKIRGQLGTAAEGYFAANLARRRKYVYPGMPEWIAETYGQRGAVQDENPLDLPEPK